MSIQQEKFKEIADAIRTHTGETDLIKPSEFSSKIADVYNNGYVEGNTDGFETYWQDGFGVGYENGYEEAYNDSLDDIEESYNRGYDEYRTTLWNGIQNNGNRVDYQNAFRNWHNADKYWKPIHNIEPTNANMMFYNAGFNNASLPELCEQAGITLSFAKVITFNQPFSYCSIGDVGIIDTRSTKNTSSLLMQAHAKKAHIILKEDGSQLHTGGCFTGANNLTDLTIEGAIGNSLPIPSPLTPESMISVITHLWVRHSHQAKCFYRTCFCFLFG